MSSFGSSPPPSKGDTVPTGEPATKRARTTNNNAATGDDGDDDTTTMRLLLSDPVDLTAPDAHPDDEPENLRPIRIATNPYKKSPSPSSGMVGTNAAGAGNATGDDNSSSYKPGAAAAAAASTSKQETVIDGTKWDYASRSDGMDLDPTEAVDLELPEAPDDQPEGLKPEKVPDNTPAAIATAATSSKPSTPGSSGKESKSSKKKRSNDKPSKPIRPKKVKAARRSPFDRSGPQWTTYHSKVLVRIAEPQNAKGPKPNQPPTKVAAFDMDGTLLLNQHPSGFAANHDDYELWSSTVLDQLRQLHDDGHLLLVVTNQAGIKSQIDGKKATFIRSVIDWIAHAVDRPVNAVVSCGDEAFHKPKPGMWSVAEMKLNGGQEFDVTNSFFVGDSDGSPGDGQGGKDRDFAINVGEMRDGTLKYHTPDEYFGPSDYEKRCAERAARVDAEQYEAPPNDALKTRAALVGGYMPVGPIMLILVGVQGAGKSTFCNAVMEASKENDWVHLSQDTINNGKPGRREAVEQAALDHLQSSFDPKSVIIDRTHLTPDQRLHFINVACKAKVPFHVVWFDVPRSVVEGRVRKRTNHAGGVEGDSGARMAVQSLNQLVAPSYDEGFDLISRVRTEDEVKGLAEKYGRITARTGSSSDNAAPKMSQDLILKTRTGEEKSRVTMPSVALGTMDMKKRTAEALVASALRAGIRAVDTAPTYENESQVGQGITACNDKPYVIVKVPKRAVTADQARDEVASSLEMLGIDKADLIILHWPCEFIESKTLGDVWKELEDMVAEGHALAIGVSNFSVGALRVLMPLCSTCYPAVNQVERHPLLPQWDLYDYCHTHGIILQAHTALGQGDGTLLNNSEILSNAKEAGISVPKMLLRWNLSQGVAVVTKCSSYDRQKAAASASHGPCLPPNVMQKLDQIGQESHPRRFVNAPFMNRPGAPYSWTAK